MSVDQEYEDILQNIESMVIDTYRDHPELDDHSVSKVYDGLIRTYQKEQKGRNPTTLKLTDLEKEVFEDVRHICEWRMGRLKLEAEDTETGEAVEIDTVDLDVIIVCLKRLKKSVKFWTDEAGKQGYLNYVSNFV